MKTPSARTNRGGLIVLAMLAMIAVPAGITLHMVKVAAEIRIASANPTPHGYTWSLLLFLVPIAAIAGWLLPQEKLGVPQRAFWRTIWILAPLGFALDFFFAHRFFVYPNSGATLGIAAPALGGGVPVEEYAFYFAGFITILLLYVWLGEYWVPAYGVADYAGEARQVRRLLAFHPTSLFVGAALIAAAVAYKKLVAETQGFPAYFTALVIGALVPSMSFFPAARRFINWRALSLTLFMILLISMFWEATLAVPYGWWGYQPQAMMGLFIGAWAGLPVEAVVVWIAVSYATVIVYEVVKVWQASGKPARHVFLGERRETARLSA